MTRPSILLIATSLAAAPAAAAETCPMTYATFEYAVPHIDLETCPGAVAAKGRFCRAAVGSDMLHVYTFAEDGEQCLVAVDSYEEDGFEIRLK